MHVRIRMEANATSRCRPQLLKDNPSSAALVHKQLKRLSTIVVCTLGRPSRLSTGDALLHSTSFDCCVMSEKSILIFFLLLLKTH
jgi:hypothetical protein